MASNTTATYPPTFSEPTVSTTRNTAAEEVEARLIAKLRALLRDGRGSMMITVQPGQVQFWKVLPDGRSEIG